MKQFTKEQLEVLSQWEDRLYTASQSKFYRNISSKSLDAIKAVYEEASESSVSANWSCNHCILAFLATVGKKYFEDKKAYEALDLTPAVEATKDLARTAERATEMVKALDEVFDEVPTEPEPKPTRKPASTKTNKRATKKK